MKLFSFLSLGLLMAGAIHAQPSPETRMQRVAFGENTDSRSERDDEFGEKRNLLVNSNFEDGTHGWQLIAFLKKGTMAIDTDELFKGKPTLRIENTDPDQSFVRQFVRGKPHTRYLLTGYIKTRDVEKTKAVESSGAVLMIGMTLECSQKIDHSTEWTKVSLEFSTKNKTEIRVGPSLGTYAGYMTGAAWFAELKLIELGRDNKR